MTMNLSPSPLTKTPPSPRHALGDQVARAVDARGVELQKFQVLGRDAGAHGQGRAVARAYVGVAGGAEGAAVAARGKERGLGVEQMEPALDHVPGQHAADHSLIDDEFEHVIFVEEFHAPAQTLLEQGVQHGVTRAVGRGAAAADRRLAVVPGVAAEPALIDAAVVQAAEGQAHVFKLDDHVRGLPAHELDGVLIAQPVRALDRVVHVEMPGVGLHVAQAGADSALGAHRMAAGGEDLADDGRVHAAAGLQSRAHARAARADHQGLDAVGGDCCIDGHIATLPADN